ncbi:DUF5689 domain-containing protein [uncultured Alistipes sp.]|uniref:DUF5689 domain-containing protein n=1 Tax=uncultured Alistipes sp. TaxID=538949 RepID=UPI0026072E5F|nr:DUF5689 domain-containing protein [uncultured Alistipes sp.]
MKQIFRIFAAVAVMAAVAGCYNDFDTPQPVKPSTDKDFEEMTKLDIMQVKQLFLKEHKTLNHTGDNTSWDDTKYTHIGWFSQAQYDKDMAALANGESIYDQDMPGYVPGDWDKPADAVEYYILGKIQSSDEEGNIYKSLHLVDETAAIEVKLGTGLYIDFPMGHYDRETGTIDTHYVYVKISDLYVGNYRMMLSIGKGPTDSYNKVGEHKFYANSNMENPAEIKERVFLGEATQLKVNKEILVIDENNYEDFFGETNQDKLGRMVLIKGITCRYGDVDGNLYPSWMCTDLRPVESKHWYKWAANENFFSSTSQRNIHCNFYGSVLFTFGASLPTQTMTAGVFTVRTSGYSRFARQPIVRDGKTGDILAIMGVYAKYWGQSYGAYQCSVNRFEDIMFAEEDFLTEAEVKAQSEGGITPDDSFVTALSNSDYEE